MIDPSPISQKAKLGPQLAWQAKTVEQATAVWAVRHNDIITKNALTPELILGIKEIVNQAFASLELTHELPRL